jgi:hypothetical protein
MNSNELITSIKTLLDEVQIRVANENEELLLLRLSLLDPDSFPLPVTSLNKQRRQEELRRLRESHTERLEVLVAAVAIHLGPNHQYTGHSGVL